MHSFYLIYSDKKEFDRTREVADMVPGFFYEDVLTDALNDPDRVEEARIEARRRGLVEDVLDDIERFPETIFDGEALPVLMSGSWSYRLFPLGHYRHTVLNDLPGRTMLYVGSDRHLYEYGPRHLVVDRLFIEKNSIELRHHAVSGLKVEELLVCLELLRKARPVG